MNITQLENEIVKAIKIEDRNITRALEEESPLNDLKCLITFVRKCFKEHNNN